MAKSDKFYSGGGLGLTGRDDDEGVKISKSKARPRGK